MINFNDLFLLQKEVDYLIAEKLKNNVNDFREFKDTIGDRKVAFKVELGELANEIGYFKYWKESHVIKKDRVLDEWADCLAFLISIMISQCDYLPKVDYDLIEREDRVIYAKGLSSSNFNWMFKNELDWYNKGLNSMFQNLIEIGRYNGFTYEELENAYRNKTIENIRRAKEGY